MEEEERAALKSWYLPSEHPEELEDVRGRLRERLGDAPPHDVAILLIAVAGAHWSVLQYVHTIMEAFQVHRITGHSHTPARQGDKQWGKHGRTSYVPRTEGLPYSATSSCEVAG